MSRTFEILDINHYNHLRISSKIARHISHMIILWWHQSFIDTFMTLVQEFSSLPKSQIKSNQNNNSDNVTINVQLKRKVITKLSADAFFFSQ